MRTVLTLILTLTLVLQTHLFSQAPSWTLSLDSVSMFSSPRTTDLNQDGTLDIVIGGGAEGTALSAGITAIDGSNGQILWQRPARDQIYGTALLGDINGDQIEDVFIGGRNAQFLAIDGSDGSLLWEFWPDSAPDPAASGWYQFYNAQWISDLDNDSLPDLLLSNGGDASVLAHDSVRPPGRLTILSAKTGVLLADEFMPDGHETYFSPLLLDNDSTSNPWIIFGTGGETVRGRLWALRTDDLHLGFMNRAQILLDDSLKGMIASPSLADLNGDLVPDLVVPELNGRLTALDGVNFGTLWSIDFPGYEMYTAPCIGQFTGDSRPDIYAVAARGQWSFYADYLQFVVDGATGQLVWTDTATHYQLSQGNAVDRDGDGWDEILVMQNRDIGFATLEYRNQFRWIDVNDNQIQDFGLQRNGLNIYSTPLLADLDGDQSLELVYAYHPPTAMWAGMTGAQIEMLDLNLAADYVAWPGYMGRDRDGYYHPPVPLDRAEENAPARVRVFPNPLGSGEEILYISGQKPLDAILRDVRGVELRRVRNAAEMAMSGLAAGMYVLELRYREGIERVKVIRN